MESRKLMLAVALISAGTAFAAGNQTQATSPDSSVRQAQQALKDKGHNPGAVDGIMGPKTESALRDFQTAQGISASGSLDSQTLAALNGSAASQSPASSSASDQSSSATSTPSSSSDTSTPSSSSSGASTQMSPSSTTGSPSSASSTPGK